MISVLLVLSGAHAATLPVGPTRIYTSLSVALDDAASGDTIEVDAGVYDSDLDIDFDVTIVGLSGSAQTTLLGDITISGADVSIEGFSSTPPNRAFHIDTQATVRLSDLVVTTVSQDSSGIGIYATGHSVVTVLDSEFTHLDAGSGIGAGVWVVGADLIMQRVTFDGCVAVDGGAIYADGAGLSLEDVTFTDNAADSVNFGRGGAIYAVNSTVADMTSTTFENNMAATSGGAMAYEGGSLILRGGSVGNNEAAGHGGGLWLSSTTASLVDVTMDGNIATDGHGGHVSAVDGELELHNSFLNNGTAGEAGGGLAATGTSVSILNGAFNDNGATSNAGTGGGLYVASAGTLSMTSVSVANNSAEVRGGGLHLVDSGGNLAQVIFSGNDALEGGGLFHNGNLTLLLDGAEFTSNTADHGGAVYWDPDAVSTVTVRDTSFTNNVAVQEGGAIHVTRGALANFVSNEFVGNEAAVGGGIYVEDMLSVLGFDNLFCANRVDDDGGGLHVSELVTSGFRNNRFVENVAGGAGAGMHQVDVGMATVINNDFLGNNAKRGGGGAYFDGAPMKFVNNLVAWQAQGEGASAKNINEWTIDYNNWYANGDEDLSTDLTRGSNALELDPELAAYTADANCDDDVFYLAWNSPLVNAGDPTFSDLDGSASDVGSYGGLEANDDAWADDDGDGMPAMWDCDDDEASALPGNPEVAWDGVDNDCDGKDLCDVDGDGFDQDGPHCLGKDCDDEDVAFNPGALDVAEDGIDQDCDGADSEADVPDAEDAEGCGCNGMGRGHAGLAVLLSVGLARRRR
jgi:predicted outer membrane repeat protein